MDIEKITGKSGEWLRGMGPEGEIVFSSRVRLARNLRAHPFPGWAKKNERIEVLRKACDAVDHLPEMTGAFTENLEALSSLEKQILVERHLISREHAAKGIGSAVVISADQDLSVMVNEEDHLRMQAIACGLQLGDVFQKIDHADSQLEGMLDYAFHPRLGYLTACPTNVGTGMRASAMLHLPALVMGDQISKIVNSVNKIGLVVRGLYGEGSEAMGNLFQVSNQTTLGESEAEIIGRLEKVILQIVGHERNARQLLIQHKPETIRDQIGRAYGILSHAHAIASKEALNLLSVMKLGIDLGVFPDSSRLAVDELFIEIQPAHLQRSADAKKMSAEERDYLRAGLIRSTLGAIPPPDAGRLPATEDGPPHVHE